MKNLNANAKRGFSNRRQWREFISAATESVRALTGPNGADARRSAASAYWLSARDDAGGNFTLEQIEA